VNEEIIDKLYEIADLLDLQQANHYRVDAYKHAANTIKQLNTSVNKIVFSEGIAGLTSLPAIGDGIARVIYEFVATGKVSRLELLKGESDPISMLTRIPGIGEKLAHKIYEELHIDSIEELENAAYNGKLASLSNIGEHRLDKIRSWLRSTVGYRHLEPLIKDITEAPPISLILDIDQTYRLAVLENTLPKITPKYFNPSNEAILPILHTSRNNWHFTALFSNSYLAHKTDKTLDWVIIYYYDSSHHGGQCTVVTEYRGPLRGKRVIRGRELECKEYYS
jgi:putative hydrolase